MTKVTYSEYLALVRDPDTSDERILELSIVRRGKTAFAPELVPDPDKVAMSPEEQELESAMTIGNSLARWRRGAAFLRRRRAGDPRPVLVAEGDSWFQFPILIRETVDQLSEDYNVWCISAAGDTASNMVYGRPEYVAELRRFGPDVRGFLFSAAGNDIIGEDPVTERSALFDIVKPFNGRPDDVAGHVNVSVLGERLSYLRKAYGDVIHSAREALPVSPGGRPLPIFIHGYDYCFPYPWGSDDRRDPSYANKDEWLGSVFTARGIGPEHGALRRGVVALLIDALYDMLGELSGDSEQTGVWLVDCRNAMPDPTDWADEIHGTSEGFGKVASRFKDMLRAAGIG
jgi:N-acetylmuramoyl-L-alanine amidase